ncbi:hypothetical protein EON76_00220 [bacterium]|nr:MAG: hypothetical protein EON76_00220 [bacterium]
MATEKNALIKDLEGMYDNPRHVVGNLDLSVWLQYQDERRAKGWRVAFAVIGILLSNGAILYFVASLYASGEPTVSWSSFILFLLLTIPINLLVALLNQFFTSQFTKDRDLERLISQHNRAVESAISVVERRIR